MKFPRWFAVLAAVMILAPSMADARAGGGSGSGSRGSKTNQAPPPTQTAPTAKPIERSAEPQQAQRPGPGLSSPAPAGGMFSRHPFLAGMMGGLLGAGLFGMLFGHGLAGGLGGMSGLLGLLLQIALIGGLVFVGLRLYRNWAASRARSGGPSYAYTGNAAGGAPTSGGTTNGSPVSGSGPATGLGGMFGGGGSGTFGSGLVGSKATPITIVESDYNAFEALLGEIQAAYSRGDIGKLRGIATAEMAGYFAEELAANAGRGVENKVEAVKLESGDLSEAWREGGIEYATVAMRFSLLDYTRRLADGHIVEGSDRQRTEATEIWTFTRDRGGSWLLSAIQQA